MDRVFEQVRSLLPMVDCNTTTAKEHVSEAKQMIRTVKEQTRGLVCMLPFKHMPCQMKIEFIYFMVFWLNPFPVKSRISGVYLPQELLVCWHFDYAKHCRVLPGAYCEVHDEPSPSNVVTVSRMHEGIAMGLMGNLQGSAKFYCLNTRRILKQRSFTPYSTPDRFIKWVNQISAQEKQDLSFRFLNCRADPYKWTDEVPEDDMESQGLLEDEEAAPYRCPHRVTRCEIVMHLRTRPRH
jgi:hypothetical protein